MWEFEIYSGNVYDQPGLTTIEDINGDGYEDIVIATTGASRSIIAISGKTGTQIWKHDIHEYGNGGWVYAVDAEFDYNDDGINDVIVGTLFSNNYGYFLNGVDAEDLESFNYSTPVDAINAIPDIVGDGTMEMVIGGRNGKIYCYSGGIGLGVGVEEIGEGENEQLSTNYPNPFSDQTTISFNLEEKSFVTLIIYNLSGTVVSTLINNYLPGGQHLSVWNGRNNFGKELPSGFYIYEISTNKGDLRRKIAKIK